MRIFVFFCLVLVLYIIVNNHFASIRRYFRPFRARVSLEFMRFLPFYRPFYWSSNILSFRAFAVVRFSCRFCSWSTLAPIFLPITPTLRRFFRFSQQLNALNARFSSHTKRKYRNSLRKKTLFSKNIKKNVEKISLLTTGGSKFTN